MYDVLPTLDLWVLAALVTTDDCSRTELGARLPQRTAESIDYSLRQLNNYGLVGGNPRKLFCRDRDGALRWLRAHRPEMLRNR